MEFLTEVLLNVDDETLIEFRNINEDTETLLTDDYIIGQRVVYRGYTKKAWDDLIFQCSELRLTCLHYLDYTLMNMQLSNKNRQHSILDIAELATLLYTDQIDSCLAILISYIKRYSIWLCPRFLDSESDTAQEWIPSRITAHRDLRHWVLNHKIVEVIVIILRYIREKVSGYKLLVRYYENIECLLETVNGQVKSLVNPSKKQITDICDSINRICDVWTEDSTFHDYKHEKTPLVYNFFLGYESIIKVICHSECEELIDRLVYATRKVNQYYADEPEQNRHNSLWVYRNAINDDSQMILTKLIRNGHLRNYVFLFEINEWLRVHQNSNDPVEQELFIMIIQEILSVEFTAETLRHIWIKGYLLQIRIGGIQWSGFRFLYLTAYLWLFHKRVKENADVSGMYLAPEFFSEYTFSSDEQEYLPKLLELVEHPIPIKISQTNTPQIFFERMRVKLGWLNLDQASLAIRLHFHPKVSRVEYYQPFGLVNPSYQQFK
jgi:hypothetical protein